MSEAYPLAARGVYAQPYLIGGRREYVAIDSRGEHVAVRLVRQGADPNHAIDDLWAELDEIDPIPPHLTPPFLRVVR